MVKSTRPKPLFLWTASDVQKWLRRHCADYFNLYSENFLLHDVTGHTLVRLSPSSLEQLGVGSALHRHHIWREILKLRLKSDILEMRELERQTMLSWD